MKKSFSKTIISILTATMMVVALSSAVSFAAGNAERSNTDVPYIKCSWDGDEVIYSDEYEENVPEGTAIGEGASAAAADKAITTMKNDNDLPGMVYSKLRLRSMKQTTKSIRLSWKKQNKAVKYVIYGNRCGKSTSRKSSRQTFIEA